MPTTAEANTIDTNTVQTPSDTPPKNAISMISNDAKYTAPAAIHTSKALRFTISPVVNAPNIDDNHTTINAHHPMDLMLSPPPTIMIARTAEQETVMSKLIKSPASSPIGTEVAFPVTLLLRIMSPPPFNATIWPNS